MYLKNMECYINNDTQSLYLISKHSNKSKSKYNNKSLEFVSINKNIIFLLLDAVPLTISI